MGRLACWIFGHKPLALDILRDGLFRMQADGHPAVTVTLCSRCRAVYWDTDR